MIPIILGTALAYFISGSLALLLAIPPGYAAPIWPAAAIALISVLRFGRISAIGTYIGSVAVNVNASWPAQDGWENLPTALQMPLLIGLGAAGGALWGGVLIRRYVGVPFELSTVRSISQFLLLAGPVSCLLSPTVGVTSLVVHGLIPVSNAAFSWMTWWIGDSLGILLFSIIFWPLIDQSQDIWRRRRRSLPLVLISTCVLMILLYVRFSQAEVRTAEDRFKDQLVEVQTRLNTLMQRQIEILSGAAALFESYPKVSRDEFHLYLENVFQRFDAIHAISWNPLVEAPRRFAVEAEAQSDNLQGFHFSQRSESGQLEVAGQRPRYLPILFIEPMQGNQAALGFDLLSQAERAASVQQAWALDQATATAPIKLVQESENLMGVIVFMPVLDRSVSPAHVLGAISGVFRITDWVSKTLAAMPLTGIILTLREKEDDSAVLYRSSSENSLGAYTASVPIEVANTTWWLTATANQEYIADTRSYVPWSILATGLLFASLLGAFLLTITGQQHRSEKSNEQLRSMLDELMSTQSELVESKRLVSLGAMVSGLAHEISTPLGIAVTANSFAPDEIRSMQKGLQDQTLTEQGLRASIEKISESALLVERNLARAGELLRTFKSVVADRATHDIRTADLGLLITESIEHFRLQEAVEHGEVTVDFSSVSLEIETIPGSIIQLITNLLNNSKLHAFDGKSGVVKITLERSEKGACIRFEDDGKGIPKENLQRIFDPFFTTRRGSGGTGLGLHIVHNLVRHQLGGNISVTSSLGSGTCFEIVLPEKLDQKLA
ncbi:MAG: CHASE domain-containing protein [Oceanococcus sp.]